MKKWEAKLLLIVQALYEKSSLDTKIAFDGKPCKPIDPSHDLLHVKRVLKNAYYLQKKEGGDLWVIVPAAILHDFVSVEKNSDFRARASCQSALAAIDMLRDIQYPEEFHEAIAHAVAAHSFSAKIQPDSLEAKIVQDADRLDALGSVGIARVFSVGQRMGSDFYDEDQPLKGLDRQFENELNDKRYTLDHFFKKLLLLPQTMQTKTGQRLAKNRSQFMKEFLGNFQNELDLRES